MTALRRPFAWIWRRLADPWTRTEAEAEADDYAAMMGAMAARGAAQSGMAQRETRRVHETHRRRRRGRRILAALAIAVAVSAFGTAYTRNRFAVGVRTAAIASAAPVALYLGLRRDE